MIKPRPCTCFQSLMVCVGSETYCVRCNKDKMEKLRVRLKEKGLLFDTKVKK